jgi:hypothetical protein
MYRKFNVTGNFFLRSVFLEELGKPTVRLPASTPIPCGLAGCNDLGGGPCRPGPVGTRVGGYRRIRWKKNTSFYMSGKYRCVPGLVGCLGIVGCKFKTHLRDIY